MLLCDARGVMQEGITSADVHYACYVTTQGWTTSTHAHFIVFAGTGRTLFSYSSAMAGVTLLYRTRPQVFAERNCISIYDLYITNVMTCKVRMLYRRYSV